MKNKIISSILALGMASHLQAYSFFGSDFDSHYKKLNDEITMFFGNDPFFKQRYPKTDIFETQEQYTLNFELPGMEKKDIKVTINEQNVLTVSGERKSLNKEEKENLVRQEQFYGTFQKSIALPDDIEKEKIKVSHKNGILSVVIPKDKKKIQNKVKILSIE